MTITICSSANFYQHAVEVEEALRALGFEVHLPKSAVRMKQLGDFTVRKTWLADVGDYDKKADFMRAHFDRVAEGDAVLVVNDEKHAVKNYIGGNVLLEMSLAFYLRKPIFVLNGLPEGSPFEEEILGMMPVVLNGSLDGLTEELLLKK